MLQKPDFPDSALVSCLQDTYALRAAEITFLPLGADANTAVYRVLSDQGAPYFLKLRSGPFDDITVAVPRLLYEQQLAPVIPPLPTQDGRLWTRLEPYALALSPFIEGRDGYEVALSDAQWETLGAAVRGIQSLSLPASLAERIPQETFTPRWGAALRRYLSRVRQERFEDPEAAALADLVSAHAAPITETVERAEHLAATLRAASRPYVLCHGDLHAGNVLLSPDGALHVVDWDTLVYAPAEHDLEQIGGQWGGSREAKIFFRGYSRTEVDQTALAYYRYHRVLEDLTVGCEQLLDTFEGGANRAQELALAARILRPTGGPLNVSCQLDSA